MLVSRPFANLPEDFNLVVDLIAHEKAAAWLEKRKINLCTARAGDLSIRTGAAPRPVCYAWLLMHEPIARC